MKNLIERLSIKSGLTKLEVSALLFVLAAIVTGALIQIFRPDAKAEIPPAKEKSSAQLLKEETEQVEKEKKIESNGDLIVKNTLDSPKININTASASDFAKIPVISLKMAKKIVSMREDSLKRGFSGYYELMLVKGIGDKMVEKIKPYIDTTIWNK